MVGYANSTPKPFAMRSSKMKSELNLLFENLLVHCNVCLIFRAINWYGKNPIKIGVTVPGTSPF